MPQTTLKYTHGDARILKDSPLIEFKVFTYYIQLKLLIILDLRMNFDVTIGHHRIIDGVNFEISQTNSVMWKLSSIRGY